MAKTPTMTKARTTPQMAIDVERWDLGFDAMGQRQYIRHARARNDPEFLMPLPVLQNLRGKPVVCCGHAEVQADRGGFPAVAGAYAGRMAQSSSSRPSRCGLA